MFHIRSHALSKYFLGLFLLLMLAWFGWNDICRPLYEQIRLTITKKETCHVYTTWLAIWSRPNHYNSFFCLAIAFLSLCFRQKIERSTLTGSNREVVISTAFHSFGLTVYGQYIYWTDFYTKKIYRANKYDGSDLIAMTTRLPTQPSGISTVVKTQQQQCSNPCDQFNGGCSHICAPGKGRSRKMKTSI